MKKLLLLAMVAVAISPAMAQSVDDQVLDNNYTYHVEETTTDYYNGDVFKNGYFKVSYANEKLKYEGLDAEQKSDWGVALDWGGLQKFTSKPIARMVYIGLDLHLALAYAQYSDKYEINGTEVTVDGVEKLHHASAGIGIGPAVAVAPFGLFDNNILRHLTVKAFYHFTPSYSALIQKEDDESKVKGGFCLYRSFGLEVAYRRLGIGFETVTGSAKYKELDVEGFINGTSYNKNEKSEKVKVESPSFRLFVSLKF